MTADTTATTTGGGSKSDPIDIIDLTVEDLKDFEKDIDTQQSKMVAALTTTAGIDTKCPKEQPQQNGGQIKFSKPEQDWKVTKT